VDNIKRRESLGHIGIYGRNIEMNLRDVGGEGRYI
jgi:hypothetical protein